MKNFQFNLQNHSEEVAAITIQDVPAQDAVSTDTVQSVPTKLDQFKTLLAQMESLGNEVLQDEIASIKQKIADEEAKLKAEVQTVEAEAITFYEKNRTIIFIVAAMLILHVAGKLGM